MRRTSLVLLSALVTLLALAGCGGGHHAAALPDCHKVYGPTTHARAIRQGLACPPKGVHPALNRSVSTVEQYDSVTIDTVPRSAHYVAGYIDGAWKTYPQMVGRWPVVTSIAVFRGDRADCIDLEPGNPTPDAARPYVLMMWGAGYQQPCVYSMLSWMGDIRANLSGLTQCSYASQPHCYRLWDARWSYHPGLDGGFNCTQWTDRAGGANLDESTCATSFYPQAGPPPPPPDPYAILSHKWWLFSKGTLADGITLTRSIHLNEVVEAAYTDRLLRTHGDHVALGIEWLKLKVMRDRIVRVEDVTHDSTSNNRAQRAAALTVRMGQAKAVVGANHLPRTL